MSIDEARQHKAMALLEFDEAAEAHETILEEIRKVEGALGTLKAFLTNIRLGNVYAEAQNERLREEIKGIRLGDLVAHAVLLDVSLTGAKKRLADALAVKKTFGLK